MGPYCHYCELRCFVERILPSTGETRLMATCIKGMARDLETTCYTHKTAINPRLCVCGHQLDEAGVCPMLDERECDEVMVS